MSNPINNINRSATESLNNKTATARSTPSPSANSSTGTKNAPAAAQVQSNNADTVSLSAESIQVRELQNRLADIPEVNAEKVASIKQEIANGNYPVDSKAIAANLLQLEKALSE